MDLRRRMMKKTMMQVQGWKSSHQDEVRKLEKKLQGGHLNEALDKE
jgi:hypothetical protein